MINLAAYAVTPDQSQGRIHAEPPPNARSEFQRDRDRIIHSTAFRRLEYKTQVFINHEGDLFRTRLTHSLEVAQIARSIARNLNLNEDLVEAISLAHDLGHTPFGHAGQDALNACMKDLGGFEHNLQSLRTVDILEERYAAFDGLNLCFETREGILKHCSIKNARLLGKIGERFLLKQQPSLEAQLANLADELAYTNHDVDDGLRSGLLTLSELEKISLFSRHIQTVHQLYPEITERRLINETVRRMINTLVIDLIKQSQANIAAHTPKNVDAVRKTEALITFSAEAQKELQELKHFLNIHLYQHYQVTRMSNKARYVINSLFNAFMGDLHLLPPQYQAKAKQDHARAVADYIAGMTDRYAIREYKRLFQVDDANLFSS